MERKLKVVRVFDVPETPESDTLYVLEPKHFSQDYYNERTDRNLGWITREDQEILLASKVAIAGCGGMGGLIAATLARLGIGTIVIFEPETFDVSNINRQFAATRETVGKSKAFETARMVRAITEDTTLVVCPQGLSMENLDVLGIFIQNCDIVFDEIEFWALGARLTLHKIAREFGVTILNCNTVGHRTYLWNFSPAGMPLSECIGMRLEDAWILQTLIQKGVASKDQIIHVKEKVMKIFLPEVPEYSREPESWSTVANWDKRLLEEGRAIVISTNPPMASGFAANHALFQILAKKSVKKRNFILPPLMPGYLMFDAALHQATIITQKWWID